MGETLEGVFSIRGLMGLCHLLVDERREAVLIDTGLVGERYQIQRIFRRLRLAPSALKAVLLTHGHLDHVGNLHWVKQWSGAKLLAHQSEQAHIDGTFAYEGSAKWCGRLEKLGYRMLSYRPVQIDHFIAEGDELPCWGGLRVMHLPGHTRGHCGFYSSRHDLLFSGDLFASYFFNVHQPPAVLNAAPELIPDSMRRVRALAPRLIVPQHYDVFDARLHAKRFEQLCRRVLD
ncbi:MAG: MBL fold metallo-hydrolase [Magnetospirillum sp.]|nr:MBL fold metallo-hydrolase [Magnetospirillum sp.]